MGLTKKYAQKLVTSIYRLVVEIPDWNLDVAERLQEEVVWITKGDDEIIVGIWMPEENKYDYFRFKITRCSEQWQKAYNARHRKRRK